MIFEEALQLVLSRLDDFGIPYMITGSFASNMHGVPRATQDVDVVIEADQDSLDKFVESLGGEFYVSPEAAREALERRRMFNIVHLETGFKVDLIIKKSRPFSQIGFQGARRRTTLARADGSQLLRTSYWQNWSGRRWETPKDSLLMP